MKTAKQTVKTEFEPIALGENVNVKFEQNVTGDHIVTRAKVAGVMSVCLNWCQTHGFR